MKGNKYHNKVVAGTSKPSWKVRIQKSPSTERLSGRISRHGRLAAARCTRSLPFGLAKRSTACRVPALLIQSPRIALPTPEAAPARTPRTQGGRPPDLHVVSHHRAQATAPAGLARGPATPESARDHSAFGVAPVHVSSLPGFRSERLTTPIPRWFRNADAAGQRPLQPLRSFKVPPACGGDILAQPNRPPCWPQSGSRVWPVPRFRNRPH